MLDFVAANKQKDKLKQADGRAKLSYLSIGKNKIAS